jgi:hypothetical protein
MLHCVQAYASCWRLCQQLSSEHCVCRCASDTERRWHWIQGDAPHRPCDALVHTWRAAEPQPQPTGTPHSGDSGMRAHIPGTLPTYAAVMGALVRAFTAAAAGTTRTDKSTDATQLRSPPPPPLQQHISHLPHKANQHAQGLPHAALSPFLAACKHTPGGNKFSRLHARHTHTTKQVPNRQ